MDPDFQRELDRTLKERAQYFTPRWFARLFAARLSLPDSFWIGMFGPLLVVVPIMVVLSMLARGGAPDAGMRVFSGLSVLLGLYWAAVAQAVTRTALRTPHAGGWRWVAIGAAAALSLLTLIGGVKGVL